jgi:hypothetical protein
MMMTLDEAPNPTLSKTLAAYVLPGGTEAVLRTLRMGKDMSRRRCSRRGLSGFSNRDGEIWDDDEDEDDGEEEGSPAEGVVCVFVFGSGTGCGSKLLDNRLLVEYSYYTRKATL